MKVLALDNSMFTRVTSCSTATTLTVLGKAELRSSGHLEVGTLGHAVVARHLRGLDIETNLAQFRGEYTGRRGEWLFSEDHVGLTSTHPEAKRQFSLDNLVPVMKQWLDRHPQPDPFGTIHVPAEWVEISFELPLDKVTVNGVDYLVVVTGQLDAIGEEGDELYTVETKFTGSITDWWREKYTSDTQNTEYQWAAEETLGREVLGSYVNAIEFKSLPTSDKSCGKHTYADMPEGWERRQPKRSEHTLFSECGPLFHAYSEFFLVNRNPRLLVDWKKDFLAGARKFIELQRFVAQGIKGATRTRTQGRALGECVFCPFRGWCIGTARDLRFADAQLGQRPPRPDVRVGMWESEEEFFDGVQQSRTGSSSNEL